MAHVAEDAICLHRSSVRSEVSTAILAYESDNVTIIPTQMDTIGAFFFYFQDAAFTPSRLIPFGSFFSLHQMRGDVPKK